MEMTTKSLGQYWVGSAVLFVLAAILEFPACVGALALIIILLTVMMIVTYAVEKNTPAPPTPPAPPQEYYGEPWP